MFVVAAAGDGGFSIWLAEGLARWNGCESLRD